MDFNTMLGRILPGAGANATSSFDNTTVGNDGSQVRLAETLLPLLGLRGFAPLYGFLGSWLGIDPTYLLATFGLAWAMNKLCRQLYYLGYGLLQEYLMSSVHISSTDEIYLHMMKWLSMQPRMVNSRALTAETVSKTAWEDEDESNVARDLSGLYLNFSNQEARAPPQYVPALGLHSFWWRGQYFRLHRKQQSIFEDGSSGGMTTFRDKEDLVISCLWRSPEPIKRLLQHAKEQYHSDHQARTIVKRPAPQNMRRYGGRYSWQQVANRPVRDMRTVVLDQRQKLSVLADINEYLHPQTPSWYANRGIPLRRGYLFHGPPGTGKTSLSFALAGVFGLDIHVISLQEPTLTEEDLSALFGALPRRCIVLLEDIDHAGLQRPENELDREEESKRKHAKTNGVTDGTTGAVRTDKDETPNDWKVSDLAKALKKESKNDEKKGISLSGLLNAIDGVASHEGRVLIMTTNVPESLDEALIRPGRVDLQVCFTNATQTQAEELFIRMYEADRDRPRSVHPAFSATQSGSSGVPSEPIKTMQEKISLVKPDEESHSPDRLKKVPEATHPVRSAELDIAVEELPQIAQQFAKKIPDGQFSPAEIQGFLLKRKKHPLRALEEADGWIAALTQQKASKSKVLQVQ